MKFLTIYRTRKFITAFKTAWHLSLFETNKSTRSPQTHFLKIYFNIIPSFMPFSYLYYFEFAAKSRVSHALGEPQKFDTRCSPDGSSNLRRRVITHWGCRVWPDPLHWDQLVRIFKCVYKPNLLPLVEYQKSVNSTCCLTPSHFARPSMTALHVNMHVLSEAEFAWLVHLFHFKMSRCKSRTSNNISWQVSRSGPPSPIHKLEHNT